MKKTNTVVLLLAFTVVATMAFPVLGAHVPVVKVNGTAGGGFINSTVLSNKSTFGFVAVNNSNTHGNLAYIDHGTNITLHGNVTILSINKTSMTATFSGTANVTNATGAKLTVPYTVDVTAGKKSAGVFSITIPAIGYTDSGTLLGGNIKIF